MVRLRPYKNCDAQYIVKWIKDEFAFRQWCADKYKEYPINADDINRHYAGLANMDNFFQMTAYDESGIVGHLIMRFVDEEKKNLRFGFVIVDDTKRGKGYGKEMLQLAVKYAFEILKVERITLGVFDNNPSAYHCYKSVGFRDVQLDEAVYYHVLGEDWKCLELEMHCIKNEYEFLLATCNDIPEIVAVYRSLVGTPGCTWNLDYPNRESAESDVNSKSLYILKKDDRIIAVASVGAFDELEHLSWEPENPYELARIGVMPALQKQGIGTIMLRNVIRTVKEKGGDGIRMLVSKMNPAALALYDRNGFEKCGEVAMYDIDFYCYQMKFTSNNDIVIRKYTSKDIIDMITIWNEVVEEGMAFPQEECLNDRTGTEFFESQSYCGVARDLMTGNVLGLYILHPNNVGRCGHICNASYAVSSQSRGRHIGEKLVQDCMKQAHVLGFKVLQFNAVVASNNSARHLYERMGFKQLGTIPGGFRLKNGDYEDICPYYIEV